MKGQGQRFIGAADVDNRGNELTKMEKLGRLLAQGRVVVAIKEHSAIHGGLGVNKKVGAKSTLISPQPAAGIPAVPPLPGGVAFAEKEDVGGPAMVSKLKGFEENGVFRCGRMFLCKRHIIDHPDKFIVGSPLPFQFYGVLPGSEVGYIKGDYVGAFRCNAWVWSALLGVPAQRGKGVKSGCPRGRNDPKQGFLKGGFIVSGNAGLKLHKHPFMTGTVNTAAPQTAYMPRTGQGAGRTGIEYHKAISCSFRIKAFDRALPANAHCKVRTVIPKYILSGSICCRPAIRQPGFEMNLPEGDCS